MSDKKKLRVVWICDVDSDLIPEYLNVNVPEKKGAGPFNSAFIEIFEEHCDLVELHIISGYRQLSKSVRFMRRGVSYSILSLHRPFIKYYELLEYITRSLLTKVKFYLEVRKINPDVITIFGTETSRSHVMNWLRDRYPVMLIIQGFLHLYRNHNEYNNLNKMHKLLIDYRMNYEIKLIKAAEYFGAVRVSQMSEYLSLMNSNATQYMFNYPTRIPSVEKIDDMNCDTDVVFAARINPQKGIEDLINALIMLKLKGVSYTLKVVGKCSAEYREELISKCNMGRVIVDFVGYLDNIEDVWEEISKAVLYVIPTYYDVIPSSLMESMVIGTPAIAYNTGAIHELNMNKDSVLLVECGNVEELSDAIHSMMNEPLKRNQLAANAKNEIKKWLDSDSIFPIFYSAYLNMLGK